MPVTMSSTTTCSTPAHPHLLLLLQTTTTITTTTTTTTATATATCECACECWCLLPLLLTMMISININKMNYHGTSNQHNKDNDWHRIHGKCVSTAEPCCLREISCTTTCCHVPTSLCRHGKTAAQNFRDTRVKQVLVLIASKLWQNAEGPCES